MSLTAAQFTEIFEATFTTADANADGKLDHDEAKNLVDGLVKAVNPDSEGFDAEKFEAKWGELNQDGFISKEAAAEFCLKWGQAKGKVAEE